MRKDELKKNEFFRSNEFWYGYFDEGIKIELEKFEKDVIKNGNKSKYFNWFFIHGDNLDLKKNNYERFADDLGMPRLNLNQNPT